MAPGAADPLEIAVAAVRGRGDAALVADHRRTTPGCVFVALRGRRVDARRFAAAALEAGAAMVVAEGARPADLAPDAVWVEVASARRALSRLAAAAWDEPSRHLAVTAVTGTNGKTTVTHLLDGIWRAAGCPAGRIGTVGAAFAGQSVECSLTTPEAPELHRHLAAMRAAGVTHVAMEASSHALAQWRLADVRLACAVLTNVSRDHLDFHRTMARYLAAKARLFRLAPPGAPAVLNGHDPASAVLARRCRGRIWRYGLDPPADVRAERLRLAADGTRLRLAAPQGTVSVEVPLPGRHNVMNALAAAAAALAQGTPLWAVAEGIAAADRPPGRSQLFGPASDGVRVWLDFAHNPDGLRAVLEAARLGTAGRVIAVFGAEGDKDRGKRPLMGQAAAERADQLWITSDDPRSEPPAAICAEVAAGAEGTGAEVVVEPDRRRAILAAIAAAAPGDLVVVAGRGPETVQIVGEARVSLEDAAVIRQALAARAARRRVAPVT